MRLLLDRLGYVFQPDQPFAVSHPRNEPLPILPCNRSQIDATADFQSMLALDVGDTIRLVAGLPTWEATVGTATITSREEIDGRLRFELCPSYTYPPKEGIVYGRLATGVWQFPPGGQTESGLHVRLYTDSDIAIASPERTVSRLNAINPDTADAWVEVVEALFWAQPRAVRAATRQILQTHVEAMSVALAAEEGT